VTQIKEELEKMDDEGAKALLVEVEEILQADKTFSQTKSNTRYILKLIYY